MSNEKYFVEIGEEGSQGLTRLDYCYNKTTQAFMLNAGLKPGMTVLDIGCGAGVMTCWIAKQVGDQGKVIAIENNQNQLNAAKKYAQRLSLNNIEFKLWSAYDIEKLNISFDLVYCRFVIHHLHQPTTVIAKIFQILKTGGIYIAEEGIVNYAFSYPFSTAWGDESLRVAPPWTEIEENKRDGNIGMKMFNKMYKAGFKIVDTRIIHPLLITKKEKKLMLEGRDETKAYFLSQGNSQKDWIAQEKELKKIINNDGQILGFYASCQVAGVVPMVAD